jgi:iron complex transport system ATP-binding protein
MLTIENLHFAFDEISILKDVSAHFEPYQIHGVIGPNGSGKSTLLKNICRIWEPQSGTVYIDNADYRSIPRKQLSTLITLVPQNASASFPISVYEMVAMGRHPHLGRFQGLTKKDREIIEKALQVTQVFNLKDRNINELSGGECQLSVIARALATEAAIIMLDEPTSDLDIQHALIIMELLADLKRQGKTIIINIHDLNLAKRYCDTITMIQQGKIFFTGASNDAFSKENIQTVFNVGMEKITHNAKSFLYFYRQ